MKSVIKEYGAMMISIIGGIMVVAVGCFMFKNGVAGSILIGLLEGAI